MGSRIRMLFFAWVIFFAGGCLFAGESLVYDLSGVTPVWDISDTYVDDIDGMSISMTLVQDGSGKIGGGGSWSTSEEGLDYSANISIKGSLKQSKGLTLVAFTIQHKGIVTDGIKSLKFSISQQVNAEIDDELLQMNGTIKNSISMAGYKDSFTEYWSEALPEGMDGSCMLVLAPVNETKGITGSAELTLSNLETVHFDIKGSNKKGIVKLSLKGSKSTGDSGASISMDIDAVSEMIRAMKGKILGQAVTGSAVPEGYRDIPATRI